jgi:hypothetical protein
MPYTRCAAGFPIPIGEEATFCSSTRSVYRIGGDERSLGGGSARSPLETMKKPCEDNFYYILYFQEPGVAGNEFDENPLGCLTQLMEDTWPKHKLASRARS